MRSQKLTGTVAGFLRRGSVSGDSVNAVLNFSYRAPTAAASQRIVNAWAAAYKQAADTRDRDRLDAALKPLLKTRAQQTKEIHRLQVANLVTEAQAQALVLRGTTDKILALQSLRESIDGNRQVTAAADASKVRPLTGRNVAAGAGLGLIIGLLVIGMVEALDTRLRRSDDVGDLLGVPLLSRIPTPSRSSRRHGRLAMIDDNDQHYSEAYRKLRVNFDFANVRNGARTVMLTSALEQEGKSTTIANLAVAMARAGRHVVLVDLDLRQPTLHEFFNLAGAAGVTDVAFNDVHLEGAMHHIPIVGASGRLHVMPVGAVPPNPPDFLESPAIEAVLAGLAERADVVLIDSAPVLPVSDSVALSAKVDALFVVVASGLKRDIVSELQRALSACQAPCLGFVLTGADDGLDGYHGAGYGYYGASPPPPPNRGQRSPAVAGDVRAGEAQGQHSTKPLTNESG